MEAKQPFLESLPFPHFLIDEQLNILEASGQAKALWGTEKSFCSLIGRDNIKEFIHFLRGSVGKAAIQVQLLSTVEKPASYKIYKQTAENNCFHVFCFPLAFDHKELPAAQKTNDEMFESAIASDQNAAIARLAAGIAHEIRNPLTTVKGFIQLLKPYLQEIGKDYYADVALDEINRANELIYEFLNAAKPMVNKKQTIKLNKLINDLVILFESEAVMHNLLLSTELSKEDGILLIDVNQLKQVLINVIKNAVEARDERKQAGYIRIKTERMDGTARIVIEDNGSGMSEETLKKLFRPYFTTKETGTGIGLSVCKKIIEDHGGNIKVKSIPHEGSVFTIELPSMKPFDDIKIED